MLVICKSHGVLHKWLVYLCITRVGCCDLSSSGTKGYIAGAMARGKHTRGRGLQGGDHLSLAFTGRGGAS